MTLQKSQPSTAMSYIQQKQLAVKEASKNYKNQIQYDNKTYTIADNMRKQSEMSNPILATLKAKRGIQNDVGFGSKPPRPSKTAGGAKQTDKPENYLGPGYYEYKGGFDQFAPRPASKVNNISQSKSCQNFMSSAPRWNDPKKSKSRVNAPQPGPGQYGQAPGDEGSFNPWFKRSYNMLFAEH